MASKKKYSRNEGKPKICRLTSLAGFQGVLIGRDMGEIFQEGHVYSAVKLVGEIVITDLGKHAVLEWLGERGTVNQYIHSGVSYLTVAEYEEEKRRRDL